MKQGFLVNIVSPTEEITLHNVEYASVLTEEGIEGFLHDHQEDSYHVIEGQLELKTDGQTRIYQTDSGHANFENNILTISVIKFHKIKNT